MIASLFSRLRRGDRNALARLISLAARGEHLAEIQQTLEQAAVSTPIKQGENALARVVAFTGSGGVGKSSLLGRLIGVARAADRRVAVLACDPQSPLTGGALLGDRFRMGSPLDDGVYIRSLAALGGHGAIADHLDVIIRLLEAFGFDAIFLETVGAGQGDVEVRNLADVVVLLVQPESGDDVQWEKAGILECADIVVVNKADLPTADQTAAQVRTALDLSHGREVPVLRVSTKLNQGHAELWQAIEKLPTRRTPPTSLRALWQETCAELERRLRAAESSDEVRTLVARWQNSELPTTAAIEGLARLLLERQA